jgi:superfamily II DNA/RNA helicase
VLSPTRELSNQILDSFRTYARHLRISSAIAIGGVPIGKQIRSLANGVDVLVATPGRLLDLVKSRAVTLDRVEVLVLDEADRMLDMGFINDIRKIVAMLPKRRQTLFFSATMPKEIASLAAEMLDNPARVAVAPPASTAERIEQRVIHTDKAAKNALLADLLRADPSGRTIVFTRTKHGADRVVKALAHAGLDADAIHGNKSQGQRERALGGFRDGSVPTLVATDIAARGIDVDGVSHVVNYDLPNIPETYVHRIGRTARAGAAGIATSFVTRDEVPFLRAIEKLTRVSIPVTGGEPQAEGSHRAGEQTGGRDGREPGRRPRRGRGNNRPRADVQKAAPGNGKRRRRGRGRPSPSPNGGVAALAAASGSRRADGAHPIRFGE